MSDWIDFSALWRIVLAGLVFGAGLPALFAVGLRLLVPNRTELRSVGGVAARPVTANPAAVMAAALCFAIVLAAIGWGIYLIVAGT
jgi:hypothetical protein